MTSSIANNYPNPLDNYKTYSYHFIMTAAASTQSLSDLIGGNGTTPLYSKVQSIGLGEKFTTNNSEAYLILDTRRFTQYTITDLEFEHRIGTGNINNPSQLVSIGTMKIQDTTGLSFFNYLLDLMNEKLKSTRSSSFFMLTTLFVGHKDDGSTETISTCHIPFYLLTMGFSFSSTGSVYDISFASLEGLSTNEVINQQVNNRCDVNNVSTVGRSKTIGGLIQSLEDQLNSASVNFYAKYNKGITSSKKPGKLVQYMITIPDSWKDFQPNLPQATANAEQRFASGGKDKYPTNKINADRQLSFTPSASITDSIKQILESSGEFMNLLGKDKKSTNSAEYFKCVTTISSDDAVYILHFDVFPVKVHTADKIKSDKINLIEYDFIYTGYNSHIQDLNIDFRPEAAAAAFDGNMRLGRTAVAKNAEAGQKMSSVKQNSQQQEAKIDQQENTIKESDPIFFGSKTALQYSNSTNHFNEDGLVKDGKSDFAVRQEYMKTMAQLHFLGTISVDMKIRGNPNIIRKLADIQSRGGFPIHTPIITGKEVPALLGNGTLESAVRSGFSSAKREYITSYIQPKIKSATLVNKGDALMDGPDLSVQGVYVKINIKAPNVDFTGQYLDGQDLYTDKMFYDGLYMVLTVKTSFSNGEFSHVLNLIAQPQLTSSTS